MRYQCYENIEGLRSEFEIYYRNSYEMEDIISYEFSDSGDENNEQDTSAETVSQHLFQNLDNGEYVAVRIFLQLFSCEEPDSEIEGAKSELINGFDGGDANWVHLLIQKDEDSLLSVVIHADYIFGFAHGMYEKWL